MEKQRTVLITGANGFIAKNLIAELQTKANIKTLLYYKDSSEELLKDYCEQADFVFHLAGVNRPDKESDYMEGNYDFTQHLLNNLSNKKEPCPVMFASSIQTELNNAYGKSKLAGENAVLKYGEKNDVNVYVYRFPNVFGKWSKPNYNTVIATFCHNIARDLPIKINDTSIELQLVYIDDVVSELIGALENNVHCDGSYCVVPVTYSKTLGEISNLIYSYKKSRETKEIPNMGDPFIKKLYSTYLSFLPEEKFKYPLKMNVDNRGSFTEFIRTEERGQVSVNISKPGITKGNHWHHTKNEKFLVVNGKGVIRFRKLGSDEVLEFFVSGERLEVIDIPVGYTHNIENLGNTDMVTIMWVNECFDPNNPDTYFLEV